MFLFCHIGKPLTYISSEVPSKFFNCGILSVSIELTLIMDLLLANSNPVDHPSIPLFWIWIGLSILIAAVVGFVTGISYARYQDRNIALRAKKSLKQLFGVVTNTLDQARDMCGFLGDLPGTVNQEQAETLESKKQGILEQLDRVMLRYRESVAPPEPQAPPPCGSEKSTYQWSRSPEDRVSGLPSLEAFEQNIQQLLNWSREFKRTGGVLLVRIDKFDSLRERYGVAGSQTLIKRLSTLLCRSIREVDLTCHVAVHTFGIILQDLTPEAGEKLATTIRNAIANSRFRIEESGPEVLITASLGFSTLKETDTVDLVLNRAQGALQRSERVGRNQLHVHDGAALVHATCP